MRARGYIMDYDHGARRVRKFHILQIMALVKCTCAIKCIDIVRSLAKDTCVCVEYIHSARPMCVYTILYVYVTKGRAC